MKQTISYWQIAGFLFTSILGTFLHFLFDISGQSVAAALFSAVSESIWEHMKLLYYPMLVFALFSFFVWGKQQESFWCIKLIGTILGLALIPLIYYTYSGIFGVSVDWVNITIFFLSAGVSFWVENKLFQKNFTCRIPSWASFTLIFMIGVIFTVFTFLPPEMPFFKDPVSGSYGFQKIDCR